MNETWFREFKDALDTIYHAMRNAEDDYEERIDSPYNELVQICQDIEEEYGYTGEQFMYSTTELSQLTGYANSTVSNILKRYNIKETEVGFKGMKYWDDSCLDILKKEKDKFVRNTISIGTLFATFNIPLSEIRGILFDKGISPIKIHHDVFYQNNYQEFYPIEAKEVLLKHLESTDSEDTEQHPLVTDKRWLKKENFPQIVPKCFEDLDDTI